jgi:hypothetical protein
MITVALTAVDIDVTHAEVASFGFFVYTTRLICCPAVRVD